MPQFYLKRMLISIILDGDESIRHQSQLDYKCVGGQLYYSRPQEECFSPNLDTGMMPTDNKQANWA